MSWKIQNPVSAGTLDHVEEGKVAAMQHQDDDSPHLMDSHQPPTFRVSVFVWQFAVHMTPAPFYLLFYPRKYRARGLRNQFILVSMREMMQFGGVRLCLRFVDFTFLRPAVPWVNLTLYWIYQHEFTQAGVTAGELWCIPLFCVTLHRVMVALKYAMLTQSELRRFLTCPDSSRAAGWLSDMQLISGWLPAHSAVHAHELTAAAERLGRG